MKDTYKREIKYLRISLTELCNLRCRYCMPEEGVCKKSHEEMMTQEEIITAVKVASKLGVTKIRLTGGEPLVKKDIVQLVSRIKEINSIEEVCITTNATLLPQYANDLKKAGLDSSKYSVHKLRHTAATLMYQYGQVDIRALQELLGHESISTTEIYTHVSNNQVRDAVERNPLANL